MDTGCDFNEERLRLSIKLDVVKDNNGVPSRRKDSFWLYAEDDNDTCANSANVGKWMLFLDNKNPNEDGLTKLELVWPFVVKLIKDEYLPSAKASTALKDPNPNVSRYTRVDNDPIYPSEYWKTEKVPPFIYIGNMTAEEAYFRVSQMVSANNWDDQLITTFMGLVIKENPAIFQVKCLDEWSCIWLTIAGKDTDISPLSLLAVRGKDYPPLTVPLVTNTPEKRLSRFFALLMLYRKNMAKNINDTYASDIAKRLNSFFQANQLNTKIDDVTQFSSYISDSNMTIGYKRIVCAIDMLFHKFPRAPFAEMKMATLPSRYKGCDALTAFCQIAKVLGMKMSQLALFALTPEVATDMVRVCPVDLGTDDIYGYFPYHLEMGLNPKAPCSAAANPTLHFWLHTIGVILGLRRSMNARFLEPLNLVYTYKAACGVGLNMGGMYDYTAQIFGSQAEADRARKRLKMSANEELEVQSGASRSTSQDLTPEERQAAEDEDKKLVQKLRIMKCVGEIRNSLVDNNGLTQRQKDILANKFNKLVNLKPNTMGEYLHQNFSE